MEEVYVSEIVYKIPGKNAGPRGKTYDWKSVKSEDEFLEALDDGWFDTLEEAVNGKANEIEDKSAATREEMNIKAKELGIEYAKNVSNKTLLELIKEKLSIG
jgi:uncharacterized protein (DUF1697 family)